MDENNVLKQVNGTYRALRLGTALLGLALPWVLWIGGLVAESARLKASMSAYYYSAMRNEFVGVLFAVSSLLVLYKGYTWLEDWALNLAGLLLIGVALFPMKLDSSGWFSPHGTFAVLFFAGIAYVCVFRASDTLSLMVDPAKARRFKLVYRWLGAAMMASPILAVILGWVLQPNSEARSITFFVEAVGVYVFAIYWLVKTYEVRLTNSETLAMKGLLVARPRSKHLLRQVFGEMPVELVPADIRSP